jgi:hypothetical protein
MILRENLGIREANPATGNGCSRKVARHLVCRAHDPAISMAWMPWKWPGIGGWESREEKKPIGALPEQQRSPLLWRERIVTGLSRHLQAPRCDSAPAEFRRLQLELPRHAPVQHMGIGKPMALPGLDPEWCRVLPHSPRVTNSGKLPDVAECSAPLRKP